MKRGSRALEDRLDIQLEIAKLVVYPTTDCQRGADAMKIAANLALGSKVAILATAIEPAVMQFVVALLVVNPLPRWPSS